MIRIQISESILKSCFYTLVGWLGSMALYFVPIHGLIFALSIAFAVSLILGLLAGVIIQGEHVSLNKAFIALRELAIYLVILASLFVIGDKSMHNSNSQEKRIRYS